MKVVKVKHKITTDFILDLYEKAKTLKGKGINDWSDWKGKDVIGQEYAGRLEFFDRVGNYSTTNIIGRK